MPAPAPAPSGAAAASYTYHIPQSVKTFVSDLYRSIRAGDVGGARALYEETFHRLSVGLYRDTPWPPAEAVAPYCDDDHVFLLLYRELAFRHAHARLPAGLTLRHRADSWDNYCSLFGVVLQDTVAVQLPNRWLWDMVDEFVYQFQRFCQYRAKLQDKSEEEINLLKHFDQVRPYFMSFLVATLERIVVRARCSPVNFSFSWLYSLLNGSFTVIIVLLNCGFAIVRML
jgi:translation initiation factor 3 subunit L